ncbi:MAG: hypothetical protein IKA23_04270 [Akkermansia sp.]|nr:hypothetical protein [Akkermansia sp.]
MVDKDDSYNDEEENLTQVRGIIKQLNEDKPSQERRREVVVRADGSKVIRVTRKKRVMLTAADKGRRSRRCFFLVLVSLFLVAVLAAGFLFYRMSSMSSSAYMASCQSALQSAWGATSVQMEGAGVEGTTLRLNTVVAEFPESSMLERVELSGVEAELDILSFIDGVIKGEALSMERALLVLRSGTRMEMPAFQGRELWRFRRVDCKDLTVQFAGEEPGCVALRNTHAYMYYPDKARSSSIVMLEQGTLDIKGWKSVRIREGKAHVTNSGIDDFSFSGTTDDASTAVEQRRTSIAFAGKIAQGAGFAGPYAVETDNMSLADFTGGRFEEFFTARTVAVTHGKLTGKATIELSGPSPVFQGEFHLKDICLSSFPALMAITEHIEPSKRRRYNPLSLHRGWVVLRQEADTLSLELPRGAMQERDLVELKGVISLNAGNEMSGELSYGIPLPLARVEYPDGHPDPIFTQQAEWAVLSTKLRGRGNMPGDDMSEVEARAAAERRSRPERIPFNQLDVNKLTEQLLAPQSSGGGLSSPLDSPAQTPDAPLRTLDESNPFETKEDPFAPAVPF